MNDEASGAKPLLDRVAIVTSSGQGIGRGVAMCLARAGAHVVVADQVSERIASVTSAIEDLGVQALGVATAETAPVPTDHGLRLHDDDRVQQRRIQSIEPYEQQAVDAPQTHALRCTLEPQPFASW
jgi:NAD(P)-dependent dehydrogenase (short-subunit alcohol dehydrogenase family)